ncbi:hypothetical protein ACFFOS_27385 [Nocardioides kongjuensis]|uniref:Uncharacterized protein n=1 Tax=Nocardioides kongjuensis TaxID=349522 RepID=A0A852RNZ7_9ACTN|nr:hypothetical protein [Nocardioides kongjuensis]NYD32725.1 hypothetical protein [Nocardioides kongjuensis]
MPVQIVRVPERHSWEDHGPRLRVYLHGSSESSTSGWADTYDVTGADVLQVIDWAQKQAGDTLTYAIALGWDDTEAEKLNPGRGRGLVWLVGMDGNDNTTDPVCAEEAEVQRRMLVRRSSPVALGRDDRVPPGVPDPYNDGSDSRQ